MVITDGYKGNVNFKQLYINSYADAEIQDADTSEFWRHVIPFTVQDYEGDDADAVFYKIVSGRQDICDHVVASLRQGQWRLGEIA